ncbi:hypothetical protein MOKP4_35710 [Mycobacterium avium subsp. hominissuis]|nr:hypothetical protein O974_17375 [Mycobacterium avium 11-0986]
MDKVIVTRADLEDVVRQRSGHVAGVCVAAVASEINEKLDMVRERQATSALRGDTVHAWLRARSTGLTLPRNSTRY